MPGRTTNTPETAGEHLSENGNTSPTGPKTALERAKQRAEELETQILILRKETELKDLEWARELAEKERAKERAKDTPEERERQQLVVAMKRMKQKRALASQRAKEEQALEKERVKEERAEQKEREKLAKEAREETAARVAAQLEKTRVGEIKLPDAPDNFQPDKLRPFSDKTGIYEFGTAELGGRDDADYFSLDEDQKQDLYDRIGVNRGVVFDPSQDNVFHPGYRPVLRGPATESTLEDELRKELGQLAKQVARLEAEQARLEVELELETPASTAGSGTSPLMEALDRRVKLENALRVLTREQIGYEQVLKERIKAIWEKDLNIEIVVPSDESGTGTPGTFASLRTARIQLMQAIKELEAATVKLEHAPSRVALIAYSEGLRQKVSDVESLERALSEQAVRKAIESLLHLLQSKRSALEAKLELTRKQLSNVWLMQQARQDSKITPTPKDEAAESAIKSAFERIRTDLTTLDDQWVALEAMLRTKAPEPADGFDGAKVLSGLRAAAVTALEGTMDGEVKRLREEIGSLTTKWTGALENLLPVAKEAAAGEQDGVVPRTRISKALDLIEQQRMALEAELVKATGAVQIEQVGSVRAKLVALEEEWQRMLMEAFVSGHPSYSLDLAKVEARAEVKDQLQHLLTKVVEARMAQATEEEILLRADLSEAEATCERLYALRQLGSVAHDRLGLKRQEVGEARSRHVAVKKVLGDTLQRARQNGGSASLTMPARMYFRKPELDAYFENRFTASETEAEAMSSGIDTTDFRVNAAFTSAFVSGGAGWGRSTEESHMGGSATSSNKVYITSSFSLPKVELSLPLDYPCASDEFLAAVHWATQDRQLSQTDKEERLFYVLREFGQFVPRRITVGGRLYSSDERELSGSETASEVAKKHGNEIQTSISVSTALYGGGVEGRGAWGGAELDKETLKSIHEAQSTVLNAVGGEGGYVKELGKWTESLQSYTRWQTINMADLCPSINVLPPEERKECIEVLTSYVRENEYTLASKKAARFLFYSGYAELVGLRPTYFYLRNMMRGAVLSLSEDVDSAGLFVVKADAVRKNIADRSTEGTAQGADDAQLWTISPDGYLINKVRPMGVELALTMKDDRRTVVGAPPDPANESQIWHIPNRGLITSRNGVSSDKAKSETSRQAADRLVLRADPSGVVNVELAKSSATLTPYHHWVVVSREAMLRMARLARVVYRSKDQIIELSLDHDGKSWSLARLTNKVGIPKAAGRPFAYMTGDGVPRVVYRGENSSVESLWLPPERPWVHVSVQSGGENQSSAEGDPIGFVGGAHTRVFFRDKKNDVQERYMSATGWQSSTLDWNLKVKGNLFAYVADSMARVVFTDVSGKVWEFRLDGYWQRTDLTAAVRGNKKAAGDPFAYYDPSGKKVRVVYRSADGELIEAFNDTHGKWDGDRLTTENVLAGDPVGFVGPDSKPRVVYRDKNNHIKLHSLDTTWTAKDLTADVGAPAEAGGTPVGFATSDGVIRVLYRDKNNHVQQLSLEAKQDKWVKTDLSELLKATNWPAESDLAGYAVAGPAPEGRQN